MQRRAHVVRACSENSHFDLARYLPLSSTTSVHNNSGQVILRNNTRLRRSAGHADHKEY